VRPLLAVVETYPFGSCMNCPSGGCTRAQRETPPALVSSTGAVLDTEFTSNGVPERAVGDNANEQEGHLR
jgi:hypothetical protein